MLTWPVAILTLSSHLHIGQICTLSALSFYSVSAAEARFFFPPVAKEFLLISPLHWPGLVQSVQMARINKADSRKEQPFLFPRRLGGFRGRREQGPAAPRPWHLVGQKTCGLKLSIMQRGVYVVKMYWVPFSIWVESVISNIFQLPPLALYVGHDVLWGACSLFRGMEGCVASISLNVWNNISFTKFNA